MEQLNLCTTTTESESCNYCVPQSLCSSAREGPARHKQRKPARHKEDSLKTRKLLKRQMHKISQKKEKETLFTAYQLIVKGCAKGYR